MIGTTLRAEDATKKHNSYPQETQALLGWTNTAQQLRLHCGLLLVLAFLLLTCQGKRNVLFLFCPPEKIRFALPLYYCCFASLQLYTHMNTQKHFRENVELLMSIINTLRKVKRRMGGPGGDFPRCIKT